MADALKVDLSHLGRSWQVLASGVSKESVDFGAQAKIWVLRLGSLLMHIANRI
jgi:hypothetical protein